MRPAEDLLNMVRELLDVEDGLTEWEVNFLNGMAKWRSFSERQAAVIEKVWDRVIGGSR